MIRAWIERRLAVKGARRIADNDAVSVATGESPEDRRTRLLWLELAQLASLLRQAGRAPDEIAGLLAIAARRRGVRW